jgi:hypothetical protein
MRGRPLAHSSSRCRSFHSTFSPFINPAIIATERSKSPTVTGSKPIVRRAESPRPMPTTMRPFDTSCSVALALAVTVGSRVPGFVTQSPRRMLSVASAAAVRNGYGSCQSRCESYVQPWVKPLRSARCRSSTKRW